ncbi:MAG: dihydrodipicolinate synthase family protein [Planctomycetaceae bacterium]
MTQFRDRFVGIIPPLITPLRDDGELDVESAERLYAFHLNAGVQGLFLFGSSGEGPRLTQPQRTAALKAAAKVVAGRVPILVGAIAAGTAAVVEQGAIARDLGADALVVCPPYYFPPSQDEISEHFRHVQAAVGLPVVAYDIPVFVGTKIAMETLLPLARDGVIVGVKDSSGDVAGFRRLLQKRPRGFRVHTGSELLVDVALSLGADGAVPGLANVDPRAFVELYEHWQAGRRDEALEIQRRLVRLFDLFADFDGQVKMRVAVGAMKTAMLLRGVISSNRLCPPFAAVSPEHVERVRSLMREGNLLQPV